MYKFPLCASFIKGIVGHFWKFCAENTNICLNRWQPLQTLCPGLIHLKIKKNKKEIRPVKMHKRNHFKGIWIHWREKWDVDGDKSHLVFEWVWSLAPANVSAMTEDPMSISITSRSLSLSLFLSHSLSLPFSFKCTFAHTTWKLIETKCHNYAL